MGGPFRGCLCSKSLTVLVYIKGPGIGGTPIKSPASPNTYYTTIIPRGFGTGSCRILSSTVLAFIPEKTIEDRLTPAHAD